jgi:hypothetical protein
MRSSHSLDRLDTAFDGTQRVADAGLLLPATLAQHLGLRELVDEHLDLGAKPGRANVGEKLLTLVMSALAGGDCIDDAVALRAGGTGRILGFTIKAASTLGTFLRSFRWGHVRQLDRVSRELLARAWAAGAGPGSEPLTIDLDSTICETYGLKKDGARHHTYTPTQLNRDPVVPRWRPTPTTSHSSSGSRPTSRTSPVTSRRASAMPTAPRKQRGRSDASCPLALAGHGRELPGSQPAPIDLLRGQCRREDPGESGDRSLVEDIAGEPLAE